VHPPPSKAAAASGHDVAHIASIPRGRGLSREKRPRRRRFTRVGSTRCSRRAARENVGQPGHIVALWGADSSATARLGRCASGCVFWQPLFVLATQEAACVGQGRYNRLGVQRKCMETLRLLDGTGPYNRVLTGCLTWLARLTGGELL